MNHDRWCRFIAGCGAFVSLAAARASTHAETVVLRPSTENSYIKGAGGGDDAVAVPQGMYGWAYSAFTGQSGPLRVHFALDGVPDGARITEMRTNGIDIALNRQITATLWIAPAASHTMTQILSWTSLDGLGPWSTGQTNIIVDHDVFTYVIEVVLEKLSSQGTIGDLKLFSVEVDYTP